MSDSDVESALAAKFARLLPHLNERQRRLAVAAEVAAVGRGGVSVVARASGLSRPTVYRGLAELDEPALEIAAGRPLMHPYGQHVAAREQVRRDVELGRQSAAHGPAQFVTVEPRGEAGVHTVEAQDRRPVRPGRREIEGAAVVTGRILVWNVRRVDREGVGAAGVDRHAVAMHLPVTGNREQVPTRVVEVDCA
jgi:hypothetical protein